MPVYWRQLLGGLGHRVEPNTVPLNGLQLMRRGPVEAVMRAQDRVVGMSRRVICSAGLRGSETFRAPSTDPTAVAGTHPTTTARRMIAAGSVDLTPGCFLRAWAVVVPSGETQISGTTPGGAQGSIEFDCSWTDRDGTTITTSHSQPLPSSTATYGAEPAQMWLGMFAYELTIAPPDLGDVAELRRWSRHVNVEVLVYAVAGARPVDVVVFEQPGAVAFEADDDGEEWCSHLYAPGTPANATLPLLAPWQRHSETSPDGDPRGGTLHMLDVHHAQHSRLGPVIMSWSGASESDGSERARVTSTTFTEVAGGGSTSFDLDEPGLGVGTGGHARRHSSNSTHVLRGRVAAIPVIVRVYASADVGDGVLRVHTRADSYIDVAIPQGSAAWHTAAGWLEVGINPDDTAELRGQMLARSFDNPDADVEVFGVVVHYGGYTPAS